MDNNGLVVAKYRLFLNGSEFNSDLISGVEEVTVEDEINLPTMFTVKFNIFDFEKGSWRGIDLDLFKPGDEIKVMMGIDDPVEMMVGEIASLDLTFDQYSAMEIRGYDRLYRLRFGPRVRSFKDMKDSEIAESIASEAGLTPQVDDTGTIQTYLFQNNQNGYEFLRERANRLGYEMFVNNKNFIFRKSEEGRSQVTTLKFGVNLDSFNVELRTLHEGNKVEVRGWDVKNKQEITGMAAQGDENSLMGSKLSGSALSQNAFSEAPIIITEESNIDENEAQNIAKARYNRLLREFVTAEGKTGGNPVIRAGKNIRIDGIGERFSGIYYIVSSIHMIGSEGYITKFKVKRTGI
ncbi:MAG: phage late control D family protein [Firmicutes bacterium]|nr:phage late control D family protein [Bacillota bacterium]